MPFDTCEPDMDGKLDHVNKILGFYFQGDMVAHVKEFGMGAAELDSWFFKARVFSDVVDGSVLSLEDKVNIFELVDDAVNEFETAHMVGDDISVHPEEIGVDVDFDRERYVGYIDMIPHEMQKITKEKWYAKRTWITFE